MYITLKDNKIGQFMFYFLPFFKYGWEKFKTFAYFLCSRKSGTLRDHISRMSDFAIVIVFIHEDI